MRIALDTGILAYSEGLVSRAGDAARVPVCQALLRRIAAAGGRAVVAAQALAELHHILVDKAGASPADAGAVLERLTRFCDIVATDEAVLAAASDLVASDPMPIFDAIALASAAEGRASLFLSQDFPEGLIWRGLTVCDPFAPSPDSPLFRWLGAQG